LAHHWPIYIVPHDPADAQAEVILDKQSNKRKWFEPWFQDATL